LKKINIKKKKKHWVNLLLTPKNQAETRTRLYCVPVWAEAGFFGRGSDLWLAVALQNLRRWTSRSWWPFAWCHSHTA